MTLHDFITLMNLLIGTSGTNEIKYMKYTSEYIPKLQIHQQLLYKYNLSTGTQGLRFILEAYVLGFVVLNSFLELLMTSIS